VNLEGLPKLRPTECRIKQLYDVALRAADALEAAESDLSNNRQTLDTLMEARRVLSERNVELEERLAGAEEGWALTITQHEIWGKRYFIETGTTPPRGAVPVLIIPRPAPDGENKVE